MILARAVDVTRRYGDAARARPRQPRHPRRRAGRPARPERRRQDHPAQPAGRAAPADVGPGRAVRRRSARPGQPARGSGSLRRRPACRRRCGSASASTTWRRTSPTRSTASELLDRFGLADLVRRQTGGLSGGQKRRLAVALAFVGRPRLVFLDEPTTGLDVEARHALWDGIRAFHADGGTVLLTSHYLEEIEALAQRVVVLGGGRVLADDTVDAVRGLVGVRRVSLVRRSRCPTCPASCPHRESRRSDPPAHHRRRPAGARPGRAGRRLPRPRGPPDHTGGSASSRLTDPHRRPSRPRRLRSADR